MDGSHSGRVGIGVALKEGIISIDLLDRNRERIDTLSKLITILAVILGGFFSYIKFFKGRVFRPKLVIRPISGSVAFRAEILHWLDIEIENKGSVPVWNYKLELWAVLHGEQEEKIRILNLLSAERSTSSEYLIDVGESLVEHALVRVPTHVIAVTFEIILTDHRGTRWERFITTSNEKARSII